MLKCVWLCLMVGVTLGIDIDPDESLSFEQYVGRFGFEAESHDVKTSDGYILLVHRIKPHQSDKHRRPVLLQHGLMGSSMDFLVNSPYLFAPNSSDATMGDNLAFNLFLTGYDVWLANSRGNKYSNRHVTLTPKDKAFWNFTFDQMGLIDLPSVVDYICNKTGQPTLGYVGFSQGTTASLSLLSLRPEYSRILRPVALMAPVAFVSNVKSPIKYLAPFEPVFFKLGGEFLPSDSLIDRFAKIFCEETDVICRNIIFLLGGFDNKHLNNTRVPVYVSYIPSPTSSWDVCHWAQNILSKRFARFDYGKAGNIENYGREVPPDYPLENIPSDAKIALFRGINDYLSTNVDVQNLKRVFHKSNVTLIEDYIVPEKMWAHTDFVYGTEAGRLVYHRLIQILNAHTEYVWNY